MSTPNPGRTSESSPKSAKKSSPFDWKPSAAIKNLKPFEPAKCKPQSARLGMADLNIILDDDEEEKEGGQVRASALDASAQSAEAEFLSPRSTSSSVQGVPTPVEDEDSKPRAKPGADKAAKGPSKRSSARTTAEKPVLIDPEDSDEPEVQAVKPKKATAKSAKSVTKVPGSPEPAKAKVPKKRLSVLDIGTKVKAPLALTPLEQKLVDACVEMWRSPATVKVQGPSYQPSRYQVSLDLATHLQGLASELMAQLHRGDSWLLMFQAQRTGDPRVKQQTELFNVRFEAMTREETIATLQTLLASAGFTFTTVNHQPADISSPVNQVPLARFVADASQLRESLKQEAIAWSRAFPPLTDHVDPRAYRHVGSSMASSDSEPDESDPGSESEESDHAPTRRRDGLAKLTKATSKMAITAARTKKGHRPVGNPFEYRRSDSMSDDPMTGGYSSSLGTPAPAGQGMPSFSFPPAPPMHQPASYSFMPAPALPAFQQNYSGFPPQVPVDTSKPRKKKSRELAAAPPYVPIKDLPVFKGSEDVHAAKDWLRELRYMASDGHWSESKRCESMKLRLRSGAKAWFGQLENKKSWDFLVEEFRKEFCEGAKTKIQLYYEMKNSARLSARMYLYELTTAAMKARINLDNPEQLAAHVTRFVNSVGDPEACAIMMAEEFDSVAEMKSRLKTYERNSKSQTATKDRERERERAREKERAKAKEADRAAAKVALAYPVYDSDNGRNTYSRSKSPGPSRRVEFESASSSDSDSGQVYRAEGRENRGGPCFVCNKTGHWGKDCPDRDRVTKSEPHPKAVCSVCNITGHDAASCWKKCKVCGKLHAREEACQTLEDLKAWVKSNGNAGCQTPLPASLLQALN